MTTSNHYEPLVHSTHPEPTTQPDSFRDYARSQKALASPPTFQYVYLPTPVFDRMWSSSLPRQRRFVVDPACQKETGAVVIEFLDGEWQHRVTWIMPDGRAAEVADPAIGHSEEIVYK